MRLAFNPSRLSCWRCWPFWGAYSVFLSPCTLPVLTAYFALCFSKRTLRIATNTLAFLLGLATTFSILGAVGFLLGRVLLQSQQLLLLVGGSIILVFGVMSLLVWGLVGFVIRPGSSMALRRVVLTYLA
ncbi:MAG: hypothetical protein M5U34_22875 [Chloroflexi bacterium]|nr:hypothetical protein [Chloroflexota bacterium]